VISKRIRFELDMGLFDKERKEELKAKLEARLNEKSDLQEKAQGVVGKFKESAAKSRDLMKLAMSGEYPEVTPQRLFSAVLIAAADLKYGIDSIDKNSHSVTFQTYKGEKFWDGRLSCFVLAYGDGARVSVTGTAEQGATTSGKITLSPLTAMTQMASEGGAHQAQSKLKFAIAKQVPLTPEPPQTNQDSASTYSHQDIPTQLKQLKDLMDAGVLSQEEFEKAKNKLLG
jgi:Tfp pilus tip-associated adhesin PilY1